MEARDIMQFIVDELRKVKSNDHRLTVDDGREGFGTIVFDEEDIDKLQKLLNIADFVEQVTKDMMKQLLFGIGKENFKKEKT